MNKYTPITDRDPLVESASAADFNTDKNNIKYLPVMSALRGMIINPFFGIAERPDIDLSVGETLGSSYKFYYDGWQSIKNGTAIVDIINSLYTGGDFTSISAAKFDVTTGGSAAIISYQDIDLDNLEMLKNYDLRLTAYVKSNSEDARIAVRYGSNIIEVLHSGGGEWERLTANIPKGTYTNNFRVYAGISNGTILTGTPATVSTGDYLEMTGFMISLQDDFECQTRTYQEELALCRNNQKVSSGQSVVQNENLNGAIEWDLMSGDVKDFVLTANSTISFKNIRGGQSGYFGVKQDGSTIYTLASAGATIYGTTLDAPDAVSKIDHWSYAVHDFSGTLYLVLSKLSNVTGL